jgi:tetratricopeptide (TPR) repeat protein
MSFSGLARALRILLLPICLLQVVTASGADKERLISLGDAAYRHRAYDSAINYYEAAVGKAADAVTLYKLGNAHYRLKHTGEAVLYYERALLRQPGFAAAAKNVRTIQQQVEPGNRKEVFFIRWWRGITAPELSNTWAVLAIIIFAALLSLLAFNYYRNKKPSWQRPQIIAGALVLATLFVIFSFAGVWRDVPQAAAVVMRPDSRFRPTSGNLKTGISLPEGLLVKVLKAGKDDVIVALPDGQEGFVQRFDIAIVE